MDPSNLNYLAEKYECIFPVILLPPKEVPREAKLAGFIGIEDGVIKAKIMDKGGRIVDKKPLSNNLLRKPDNLFSEAIFKGEDAHKIFEISKSFGNELEKFGVDTGTIKTKERDIELCGDCYFTEIKGEDIIISRCKRCPNINYIKYKGKKMNEKGLQKEEYIDWNSAQRCGETASGKPIFMCETTSKKLLAFMQSKAKLENPTFSRSIDSGKHKIIFTPEINIIGYISYDSLEGYKRLRQVYIEKDYREDGVFSVSVSSWIENLEDDEFLVEIITRDFLESKLDSLSNNLGKSYTEVFFHNPKIFHGEETNEKAYERLAKEYGVNVPKELR